jgi:hypothetical protein
MNPADRNKILIIGGVAVVAIAVIVFFFVRGRKPAGTADTGGGFGTQVAAVPAGGGEAPVGGAPTGPAAGEEVAPEVGQQWVGVIARGRGGDEPSRSDSFLTFEPKIEPPPPEIETPLPMSVGGPIRPEQPTEMAVLGTRRVAGVKFNERPWAILEEGNETFIVKPGDVVDGLRILAIARQSVYVEDSDGNRWGVPLRGRGAGSAAEVRTPGVSYIEGMPELPPVGP